MTAALQGIKVLDLSDVRTGAQVSQVFADFGADVIQIERPGGSELRSEAAWPFWGRGKRAVQLNLKAVDDRDVFLSLAAEADVVIECFRPGVADRLGIGYERLKAINPRVVYVSISAFGAGNALSRVPGYEGIVAARTGVLWSLEGLADRTGPCFCAADYASFAASQLASQGAFAALLEREDSGVGQRVDINMAKALTIYDIFGIPLRTIAKRFEGGMVQTARIIDNVPTGGLSFRLLIALTKDGRWLQFSQSSDRLYRAMMKMFGLDWMFDDPEWSTAPDFDDDLDKRIAYWEIMLNKVREKTVDEWMTEFDRDPNVWGEMFRRDSEVLHHPQMEWNKMVVEIDDPDLGVIREPGPLAHLSKTPADVTRLAPRLGEFDTQVREEAKSVSSKAAADPANVRDNKPPLEGLTIVELSSFYAAPYGATLLGELGARVIKLEELTGDAMRHMLPFPESGGIKCMYGKESVAVDLTKPEGHEIALRVIDKADIVLCSFREGSAERLRLDAKTLRARNPDLIYMNAPGYGVDGPYARRPAFAPTIGAASGLAWRNSGGNVPEGDLTLMEVREASCRLATASMGVGNADGLASISVATVMALGLLVRKRGGGGQELFTSMLSSAAHGLSDIAIEYPGRQAAQRADPGIYGFNALYRLYQAKDAEYIFLAIRHQHEWQKLVELLQDESDALARDPRFADHESRRHNDGALADALSAVLATRNAQDWENLIAGEGLGCVVAARGPLEANYCDDDKLGVQMGWLTAVPHPILDEIPRMKPLIDLSRSNTVTGAAGICGQETEAVLSEFGYTKDEIAQLEKNGVIMRG